MYHMFVFMFPTPVKPNYLNPPSSQMLDTQSTDSQHTDSACPLSADHSIGLFSHSDELVLNQLPTQQENIQLHDHNEPDNQSAIECRLLNVETHVSYQITELKDFMKQNKLNIDNQFQQVICLFQNQNITNATAQATTVK